MSRDGDGSAPRKYRRMTFACSSAVSYVDSKNVVHSSERMSSHSGSVGVGSAIPRADCVVEDMRITTSTDAHHRVVQLINDFCNTAQHSLDLWDTVDIRNVWDTVVLLEDVQELNPLELDAGRCTVKSVFVISTRE